MKQSDMWWLLVLVAILIPIGVLLILALLSTFGLEADQERVKRSFRWFGTIGTAYGFGAGSWFEVLCGAIFLVISHPKVNLPLISKRIDRELDKANKSSTR